MVYNQTSKDKNGNNIPIAQTRTKLVNIGILKIATNGVITSELVEIKAKRPKSFEIKAKLIGISFYQNCTMKMHKTENIFLSGYIICF